MKKIRTLTFLGTEWASMSLTPDSTDSLPWSVAVTGLRKPPNPRAEAHFLAGWPRAVGCQPERNPAGQSPSAANALTGGPCGQSGP